MVLVQTEIKSGKTTDHICQCCRLFPTWSND